MNQTRIGELRKRLGWTQEQLAERSTVAVRTIQRLESGSDASMETLALIAEALGVPVADLFAQVEDRDFAAAVRGLGERTEAQQTRRDAFVRSWHHLFGAVGVIITIGIVVLIGAGDFNQLTIFIIPAYWAGGHALFTFFQHVAIDPWLDKKYPLSSPTTREARTARP
jgi:transcriptional regulator with XRE-family HTH domain